MERVSPSLLHRKTWIDAMERVWPSLLHQPTWIDVMGRVVPSLPHWCMCNLWSRPTWVLVPVQPISTHTHIHQNPYPCSQVWVSGRCGCRYLSYPWVTHDGPYQEPTSKCFRSCGLDKICPLFVFIALPSVFFCLIPNSSTCIVI